MCLALFYASITDAKRREIPIWLFPSALVLHISLCFDSINWYDSAAGLLIGIAAFSLMALKYSGGGGDIIMMGCLGAAFGTMFLMKLVVVASVFCLISYVLTKKDNVPYAPYVFCSYIILVIGGILNGFNNNELLGVSYYLL